jgi:4-amino-4-deoxy-L-arabinose transferase-like glycosyltransferase
VNRGGRGWLALAVGCYLLLASGWLFWMPAFEPSDENTHVQSVLHYAQGGGLAVVRGTAAKLGLPYWTEQTQAYQPPLYFWLMGQVAHAIGAGDAVVAQRVNGEMRRAGAGPAARMLYRHGPDESPPYGPGQRKLLELRAVSALLGLGVLLLVFALGRRVFPEDPGVAGLAALLVACFPRFLHEAASVHNETLSTLLAHVALLLLAAWTTGTPVRPARAVLLGLVIGLALLTKLTSLFLLPLVALVLLLPCLRERRWPGRDEWISGALVLGGAASVAGWWFLHNVRTYGDPFALGPQRVLFHTMAIGEGEAGAWLSDAFLRGFFGSLLGNFGWGMVATHAAAALSGLLLLIAAAGGWLLWRRGRGPFGRPAPDATRMLRVALFLVLAQFFVYNLRVTGPDSRYIFGALGPLALLVAAGLLCAWRAATRGRAKLLAALLVAALPLGSGALLVFQARPAFRAQDAPSERFHASLVLGAGTVPERPAVRQLDPPDGARLVDPPLLRWRDVPRDASVPWTVDFALAPGRPILSTYEQGGFGQLQPELALPRAVWERFPVGQTILWRVRLLPDRSLREDERQMPSSGFSSFTRVAH